jgi:multicomponent K+:H+ antiporter subunit E
MRRWLPFPIATAALAGMWLLLNESLAAGTLLLGAALALALSWTLPSLDVPKSGFRRVGAAVNLALVVLVEIVRSNNAVARIILGPGNGGRRSGFVRIPLDMRNPYGLTALACIITATPGTIWVEYESTYNTVLIHVLDLIDEQQWVRIIKDRYESRLMEVLE